ncbi:MAG: hypothetical protein KIIPBIDF_01051 [Candidatus Methanoperedenaceae archaeon GB50]|nr:MAG: hypothetical protein KIIPBIDF_01051 [Candidatus Methanoperedenaceae archaeon GB50]
MSMIRIENLYKKFGKLEVLRVSISLLIKGKLPPLLVGAEVGNGSDKTCGKGFFFLANLNFFRSMLQSAVKAVSPKGAE